MARWQVELRGDVIDRAFLEELFTAPELRVIMDGEQHFLEAAELDELDSAGAVDREAIRLLTLLNGIARLRRSNHHDVQLGRIYEPRRDGARNIHGVAKPATLETRAIFPAPNIAVDGEPPARPEPGTLETDRMLRAGLADPAAQKALRIWGRGPRDWHRLSNIIDIVQAQADIVGSGWASRKQLERFRRTANHAEAAGDDARHGHSSVDPPPHKMTPPEATAFVSVVLGAWLRALGVEELRRPDR